MYGVAVVVVVATLRITATDLGDFMIVEMEAAAEEQGIAVKQNT